MLLHEDIGKYVKMMRAYFLWHGTSVPWDNTWYAKVCKFYCDVKWIVTTVVFVVVGYSISTLDDYGLLDGTFLNWLTCLKMMVVHNIARFSGQWQEELTLSLNGHFLENTEPWMLEIKDRYIKRLWKFLKLYHTGNYTSMAIFLGAPLIADTVLHYGFDCLESPFTVTMPLTPLIGHDTWDLKHYFFTVVNYWIILEIVLTMQLFIANFSLLTTFFLTELVIFKHQIKNLHLGEDINLNEQVKFIVDRHNKIIRLNQALKNYLGLSGAFISFFTSLSLTVTSFTIYSNANIPLSITYGSGFIMFGSSAVLYCVIGQELENESDELFVELYGLPWYRFSPSARKSLNMMMIQVRTNPLTINYRGYFVMNLAGLMEILKTSYSYFTILQSMADKESENANGSQL